MEHIKYSSIEQFRHVIREVHRRNSYKGKDENGEPLYDNDIKPPVVKAIGTVKLHGTNGGVAFRNDEIWSMSRKNVITPQKDNAGFALFVEKNKEWFKEEFKKIAKVAGIDNDATIVIYGEWAGEGIQSKVAISKAPKGFYIFGLLVDNKWENIDGLVSKERHIYNINDYKTFEVEINFERPDIAQNKFYELTMEVEKECPVAKQEYDISGIGEGIVWSFYFKDKLFRFKTKGEDHASGSKPKVIKEVNLELENEKRELLIKLTPNWRLAQGLEEIFTVGWTAIDLDRRKLGDYIRWVINDIYKEDIDLIKESNLDDLKEINSLIAIKAKNYFFEMEKDV